MEETTKVSKSTKVIRSKEIGTVIVRRRYYKSSRKGAEAQRNSLSGGFAAATNLTGTHIILFLCVFA
jgi:hypothetical protein